MSTNGSGSAPPRPMHTRREIASALSGLGVRPGDTLLVHSSLSSLGWVPAGALAAPARHMGAIPEQVRTWPGALRSSHPQTSFAAQGPSRTTHGAAVLTEDGDRAWVTFEDLDLDEEDFEDIGTHLRSTGGVRSGMVGEAESHLFDMTAGVEAARPWMADHRRPDDGAVTGGAAGS